MSAPGRWTPAPTRPRIRLRVPSTRLGAAVAAGAIAAMGFVIGVSLIAVGPMIRSGQGPFALLSRGSVSGPIDLRSRFTSRVQATPISQRVELWRTPTGTYAFPSAQRLHQIARTSGSGAVVYEPNLDRAPATPPPGLPKPVARPVLPMPLIRDAVGRPSVAPVVSLSADDDPRTPGPLRADASEPTQLTIAAASPEGEVRGCVFVIRDEGLVATATLGSGELPACQSGVLSLAQATGLVFAVEFETLPNYQSRNGGWRPGAVFGRTVVRAAATDLTG